MSYTKEELINRTRWDELASVHLRSYALERLYQHKSMLGKIEQQELGDIAGKKILHLQCHIGHDTFSLELGGAEVTGVDFSEKSIEIARKLGQDLHLKARFYVGNVLHLGEVLDERFDLIYTSNGVLCWIGDIQLWAQNIAKYLNDDGVFYIYEYHPFAYVFDEGQSTSLRLKYDYFLRQPYHFPEESFDYTDKTYISKNPTYEWLWPVCDIQNALIDQGFAIEFFHEFDTATFQMFPFLEKSGEGYWKLPSDMPSIPLMFSLKAKKHS